MRPRCEIFRRLIVGSEGTLAFIVEAVFDTIPDDQFRLTSFMIFPDMYEACAAVKPFVDSGAAAVELLDRASLRAVEGKPGVPDRWKALARDRDRAARRVPCAERGRPDGSRAHRQRNTVRAALLEPARIHERPGSRGAVLERTQRTAAVGRRRAPAGLILHPRGCLLPAGTARRRRARPAGAVCQARLRGRRLRARVGRQPAFPDHAVPERREGHRAFRPFMRRCRRARRRQIRRFAQGRAWHRTQRRTLRRARMGSEAHRTDVEAEATRGSAEHPLTRGHPHATIRRVISRTFRRRPSIEATSIAAFSADSANRSARAATSRRRRGSGLRCGGRWHARPECSRAGGDSGGLRLRRDPDLRGRRLLRDRLPGRHQYRRVDQAPPASGARPVGGGRCGRAQRDSVRRSVRCASPSAGRRGSASARPRRPQGATAPRAASSARN